LTFVPNVSLTPELERFTESCVRSGRYGSVSEVTRAALRLLQEVEERRAALLASLRDAEAEGEREGFLTADEVAAEVRSAIKSAMTRQA
jgi:antitoxin ParD1/3/4